jgi:hypothetical protein
MTQHPNPNLEQKSQSGVLKASDEETKTLQRTSAPPTNNETLIETGFTENENYERILKPRTYQMI